MSNKRFTATPRKYVRAIIDAERKEMGTDEKPIKETEYLETIVLEREAIKNEKAVKQQSQ